MQNHFTPNYILAYKVISIDNPLQYACAVYTKTHIFVLPSEHITDSGKINYHGKNAYEVFASAINQEMTNQQVIDVCRNIVHSHVGTEFDLEQLNKFVVKNGFFSRGIYMKENINTVKKYNRCLTVKGKELGGKLQEFYANVKLHSWSTTNTQL